MLQDSLRGVYTLTGDEPRDGGEPCDAGEPCDGGAIKDAFVKIPDDLLCTDDGKCPSKREE